MRYIPRVSVIASAIKEIRRLGSAVSIVQCVQKENVSSFRRTKEMFVPSRISDQAIKSFHNYTTLDRCIVQHDTLKGLSVARGKKRLWRETKKERKTDG